MNPIIPHDIPLPLPAPALFLKVLLVVAFLAHIIFVNLMVGGSILTFIYEWKGLKNKIYDTFAREIAKTITVNKSLAVVLGVAPLLLINVLYTVWFYASNTLTGSAWILIIPLVIAAFLLTYLHQYSWDRLSSQKGIHLSIIGSAVVLFLAIPLIFLVNINLMLFPDRWSEVKGFFSALLLPNVFPRYLHFIGASLAFSALFLVGWLGRATVTRKISDEIDVITTLRKDLYAVVLVVSSIQFIVGPLVLFTLPSKGLSFTLFFAIVTGAGLALPALFLIWKEIQSSAGVSRNRYRKIVSLLCGTAIFMASGRHLYREAALEPHQKAMKAKTEEYQSLVTSAKKEDELQLVKSDSNRGKTLFQTCGACHGINTRIVGPPLTEIVKIYAGNPAGIVAWAKAPGKKREGYPQMPAMPLPDGDLLEISKYMLEAGAAGSSP